MTINHPVRLGEFASLTLDVGRKLNLGKVSVPLTGQLAEDGTTVEISVGEVPANEIQRLSNVAEEVFSEEQIEATLQEDAEDDYEPGDDIAVWTGVIGMEGVATGDGRLIEIGALNWQTPQDFRSVKEDVGGHDGAVVVGTTLYMDRDENGEIFATGTFDLGSEEGAESARQVKNGISTGVSMDLDDMTFEVRVAEELIEKTQAAMDGEGQVELQKSEDGKVIVTQMNPDDEMHVITSARVRASTRVSIPAFAETGIKVIEDDEDSLDEEAALEELDPEVEGEGVPEDEEELAAQLGEFKNWVSQTGGLPKYIRSIANQLMAKGMAESRAIASAVNTAKRWARGGTVRANGGPRVSVKTVAKAAAAVSSWYAKRARANAMAGDTESLTAAGGPNRPPREWFSDPKLTGPTPLRVQEDGRVFGHLATWDSCHIAHPDNCTAPPESRTSYSYFLTGGLITDDGSEVSVGHLTLGTGHADEKMKLHAAAAHYDNTGTVMADVSAGEDAYGIWVAGGMRSSLTEEQVRAFRAAPLSGDWRYDQRSGNLELVAALSVNVPGFPIPRPKALVSSGQVQSLVASGIVEEEETPDPSQLTAEEVAVLRSIVVETQERERIKKAAALADRVKRITEGK